MQLLQALASRFKEDEREWHEPAQDGMQDPINTYGVEVITSLHSSCSGCNELK
jgi:hypothetical protein